ncbi:type VII secretion protein EccB [Streptomyces sp. NRRL S-87]|uniref:type VII secretion protein EccB n=1 Tax=Streptomyces sp. NRRL S-87 TaxID=1463920 RepID=UPI0004C12E47|nr:type VII secretion protein EccB [Streptomyces sp. NRRL S-87]
MASRRDELNAYTFAKRRTVAAFLQPSATGSEEGAPRPLRAVVPSLVAGALVLAGFGAWGMFKPVAPKGWDTPGAKVVVGEQSTTRYVVLKTGDKTLLHPVLNLASARLLLTPQQFDVIQVSDEILDSGKPPRGPILGIPYAPDRLPTARDAGTAKRWAVCQQPGAGGHGTQTAAFVLADRDAARTEGPNRLTGAQVLYVHGPDKTRYLVDATGTKYAIAGPKSDRDTLVRALVGETARSQPVTAAWLAALRTGTPVAFPELPGRPGADAELSGLATADNRVGLVLRAQTGAGPQHYVVLPGKVQPVSEFTAWLLINAPATAGLDMNGRPRDVDLQSLDPARGTFAGSARWPQSRPAQVNRTKAAAPGTSGAAPRDTVCAVLREVDAQGRATLSTWAGTGFPVDLTATGTSTYVTPGTGLLYTQVQGGARSRPDGSLFLLTDTGLRYALQANGDSDARRSAVGAGAGGGKEEDGRPEASQARIRLGYEKVVPAVVPIAWSEFLSKGPRLDTNSARQPQGS